MTGNDRGGSEDWPDGQAGGNSDGELASTNGPGMRPSGIHDPAALELGERLLSPESLNDYLAADLPDYHYIADWHCPNFVGINPSHYIALLNKHGLAPVAAAPEGLEFKAAAGMLGLALEKARYFPTWISPPGAAQERRGGSLRYPAPRRDCR